MCIINGNLGVDSIDVHVGLGLSVDMVSFSDEDCKRQTSNHDQRHMLV